MFKMRSQPVNNNPSKSTETKDENKSSSFSSPSSNASNPPGTKPLPITYQTLTDRATKEELNAIRKSENEIEESFNTYSVY